jgi:hypothetical protein
VHEVIPGGLTVGRGWPDTLVPLPVDSLSPDRVQKPRYGHLRLCGGAIPDNERRVRSLVLAPVNAPEYTGLVRRTLTRRLEGTR